MISLGTALAICGAAIAAALAGVGSAMGVGIAGQLPAALSVKIRISLVRFSCFRPFLVRRAFTVY